MMFFLPCFTATAAQLVFSTMPFILMFSTVFLFCCKKKPKQDPKPPKFLKDWPSEKVRANEKGYGTLSAIQMDQLFPEHGAAKSSTSNSRMAAKSI